MKKISVKESRRHSEVHREKGGRIIDKKGKIEKRGKEDREEGRREEDVELLNLAVTSQGRIFKETGTA